MSHDAATITAGTDVPDPTSRPKPWGFWATTGLTVVILALFTISHSLVGGPYRQAIEAENPGIGGAEIARLVQQDGQVFSIATVVSGVLCSGLILLLAWLRRGIPVRSYLALVRPEAGAWRTWLLVGVVFVAAAEGLKALLDAGPVPDFVLQVYATVRFLPLLWIAAIVVAPVFEELLFRGFLFAGWSRSRLGPIGTIVVTSLLWSAAHAQYDGIFVALIFVFGLIAGMARHRTGSLLVPIALHVAVNLVATIQTAVVSP